MAAGIAGDELGDVWKYTTAGAALSSAALPGAISSARSSISEAYKEGAYGPDTLISQAERDYVKSTEYDAIYQHEFKHEDGSALSKSELKAKKEQGAYYSARGIDGDNAIKAIKLEDKLKKELGPVSDDTDVQGYIARIMKEAKGYDAKDLRDKQKVTNLTNSLKSALEKGGYSSSDAGKEASRAVKYIKAAKGVKD